MRLPYPRSESPPTARSRAGQSSLHLFNAAAPATARGSLLACCGSRRWVHRMENHRPYPDRGALLAAADEASYDMSHADLAEALAAERPCLPPTDAPGALTAYTALRAGHAAYAERFGHAFVVHLDDFLPEERLDQALSAIHARLAHEADTERAVAADELRRLAAARLARLVTASPAGAAHP